MNSMISRITIRNFKRFGEQSFDLRESLILAGPNNSGKSTLLQAIAMWKLALDKWVARREGSKAVRRSGITIPRTEITAVPLREMNLLWEGRKVSGPRGMSGAPRLIEIIAEGVSGDGPWECGIEFQYANPELLYARPLGAKGLDREAIQEFPLRAAKDVEVVYVPPLSGIERDEPRRELGMQNLLIGQGLPGQILRNLLLEITDSGDWDSLTGHFRELFGIAILRPVYSPSLPYIKCEYREHGNSRPLDLSNAGSGFLQVLLLFAFLYARPAAVILLDEPDAHQHFNLQGQVYDLIRAVVRKRGGQVIVATHSEVLLNATEPEHVTSFFGDAPKPLTAKSERDQVREALKRVTTTDLLRGRRAGGVLYVEGSSDERILKAWAQILEHPAQEFFRQSFVHWLGGRSLREAMAHFFAMRAAFPELSGLCLLDGDNRDEPSEESVNSGLTVLRWRRYEIENYLLQPECIKRFLEIPLMQTEMKKRFWQHIPPGTDLFGDHVSLTRVKASKEFLVPLFEELGMNTPKNDLHLLAATMRRSEINPEITEKLDTIARVFSQHGSSQPDTGLPRPSA